MLPDDKYGIASLLILKKVLILNCIFIIIGGVAVSNIWIYTVGWLISGLAATVIPADLISAFCSPSFASSSPTLTSSISLSFLVY